MTPTLDLGFTVGDIITQMNGLFPVIAGILAFAVALPVTFWVARKIRGLVPSGR